MYSQNLSIPYKNNFFFFARASKRGNAVRWESQCGARWTGEVREGDWGREKREAFDLEKRCYRRFYNVIVEVAKLCSFFYSPLFLMCLACWRIRCCCCCWVALRNCLFKHKLRLKTFKCVVRNARLHFDWNWTISGNSQIRVKGVKV